MQKDLLHAKSQICAKNKIKREATKGKINLYLSYLPKTVVNQRISLVIHVDPMKEETCSSTRPPIH